MAKGKRKGGRRKRKMSILATAGFLVGAKELWTAYRAGGGSGAMASLTGYIPGASVPWKMERMTAGLPMFLGAGGSMLASKTGINRYLNIPFFKL